MSTRDRAERILSRELAGHHELYGPDEIAADVADALDRAGLLAHEPDDIAKIEADALRAAAAEWAAPLSKHDRTPRTGAHVDQWLRDTADAIERGQS